MIAELRVESTLHRLNRTLRTLLKCNEALVRAKNEDELLLSICRIITDSGGYRHARVGFAENDEPKTVRTVAQAGFAEGNIETQDTTLSDTESGRGPTWTAIHERLPCLVKDIQNNSRYSSWLTGTLKHGYLSVLSVPLVMGNEILGALTVNDVEPDAFDEDEVNLIVQLAGDLVYGIMSLRTAAEHRCITQALSKSENILAEAQSIAHLGSWEYDVEKDEEFRSAEFFRILGLPPQETGRAQDSVFNFIHPDDKTYVLEKISETLEEGKPYDAEYRIIRPDGEERVVHAKGKTLIDAYEKTTKFIGTILDITDWKHVELALRNSEVRFRTLVETSTDWIWEVDENLVYVYSSPKVHDILGYKPEEVIGKTPFDFMHPRDAQRLAKEFNALKLDRKPFSNLENVNIHKNGGLVTIETSSVPIFDDNGKYIGCRGIDRDVTGRKKLENEYLQAQKMEAIGQLAGGIAHDFNNILTAIIGYQHLLIEKLEEPKLRNLAGQVTMLAEKASILTKDLLAFSRKQPSNPKLLDLNEAVKGVRNLLQRIISEDIEFLYKLHKGSMPVLAVDTQIEQILMNLVTNASDAMPNGGTLAISTEVTSITPDFVWSNGYGVPGAYALITVSDSGTGMDEETCKRIFEPFFTTKELGKGTGLGMSTVYGIVKDHRGFINLHSKPGEGTTFYLYFPLADGDVKKKECARDHLCPPRGTETILLAEDEPELRDFMRTLMEGSGYNVIDAVDGDDALEKYVLHEADIDLLLFDMVMPKRSGSEAYDFISRTRPEIKTIFISGYTADIIESKGIPGTCHLVTKPFSPHAFLIKLRAVLDEAP